MLSSASGADSSGPDTALPRTGPGVSLLVTTAALCLITGLLLGVAARRRR